MTALTWGKEQVLETLEKKKNKEAEYSQDSQVSAGNFWKIFTIFLFSAPCLFTSCLTLPKTGCVQ